MGKISLVEVHALGEQVVDRVAMKSGNNFLLEKLSSMMLANTFGGFQSQRRSISLYKYSKCQMLASVFSGLQQLS